MHESRTKIRLAAALCAVLGTAAISDLAHAVPAFSGAEGFGAVTGGGRNGQVVHVTNLNDSGPGSFRAAVTGSGPRTVVFDISGQINLTSELSIQNPYLTISGQTAPGDGITIAGETVSVDTHDVIIRYLRFRRGNTTRADDALGSDRTNSNDLQNPKTGNIIVDHVSASWGLDENLSIYRSKLDAPVVPGGSTVLPTRNVTVQWSISSEALNLNRHAFGSTLGGAGVNHHHNLWASNTGRNPSISFSDFMDFRNNVLFNWMHRSVDGAGPEAHVNMINNYYKPGPATGFSNDVTPQPVPEVKVLIVEPELRSFPYTPDTIGDWYVNGNFVEGYPEVSTDNWEGESQVAPGVFARGVQFEDPYPIEWARVNAPITHVVRPDDPDDPFDEAPIPDLPTIATQSAQDAFQAVLSGAGASLVRDAVDIRVTNMVATGTVSGTPNGIINNPSQVGGYPTLPVVTRDANWDADQDGMRDSWETEHDLNPANAADRNGDFDTDGYTNLEDYLNEVGAFQAVQPINWDGSTNNRYAQIENWDISFQPSRFDTVNIHTGTAIVDAVGQHAGSLLIASNAGNTAQLNITAGRLEAHTAIEIGGAPTAQGTLNLSGGELITPLLAKGQGGTFNFTGGTLHADSVDFNLTNNGGMISPGTSIGTTDIDGALTLNSGVLEIEIGGKTFGQYDRVTVQGPTTLGGTLKVEFVDLNTGQYAPQAGDTFGFLAAFGGASGMFDNFDLPDLPTGLAWALTPGDVTVFLTIRAALAGDYNNDGAVNAADYVTWRKAMAGGISLANETATPGSVDAADYDEWSQHFAASASGAGTSARTSAPEPSGFWLAIFTIAVQPSRHRRMRVPLLVALNPPWRT
jgi:hypothetical protein